MKKIIAALVLITTAAIATAEDLPTFPFVFTVGEASTQLAPETALVSFALKVFDKASTNAVTVITQRSKDVLSFLSEQKVKNDDITAYEIEKDEVRDRKETHPPEILGYDLQRRISVTIRDLSTFDSIMKRLLGTDNLAEIQVSFDRTDRQRLQEELLAKAGKDARAQADKLAKSFGTEVASVFAISQRGFAHLGKEFGLSAEEVYYRYLSTFAPFEQDKLLFVPATIKFNAGVSAIFKLKETK